MLLQSLFENLIGGHFVHIVAIILRISAPVHGLTFLSLLLDVLCKLDIELLQQFLDFHLILNQLLSLGVYNYLLTLALLDFYLRDGPRFIVVAIILSDNVVNS